MDGPASLITSMIGLQIAPHFDKPFLAESLTSFWGKRWNLTISNCLRGPVYDPMYEGTLASWCPCLLLLAALLDTYCKFTLLVTEPAVRNLPHAYWLLSY